MSHPTAGFTLIELLVVIAILGILSVVLIPSLLNARNVSQDRAAQAYGQNVYKAAWAYISEGAERAPVASADCSMNYTAGAYQVMSSGSLSVTSCQVSTTADNLPRVVVVSRRGTTFNFP